MRRDVELVAEELGDSLECFINSVLRPHVVEGFDRHENRIEERILLALAAQFRDSTTNPVCRPTRAVIVLIEARLAPRIGAPVALENVLEALRAMLRALRLASMADDLPELLETSQREGWGQLDLLFELFQREDVRKRQRRFERNLKASGLSEAYGLEHFDFDLAHEHGVEPGVVRDLTQCEFVRARRNIILAGGVGTGKTFLARTLGIEALKRGFKVMSFNTADLVDMLYSKRSSFRFGQVYKCVRDVHLLILDDLAYLPYAPEKVEFLFSLVVDRHELERGATIVTSNTDVTEWWQFFPSKAMGMALSDRLLEGAQGIRLTGGSIRPTRPQRKLPEKRTPPSNGTPPPESSPPSST